LPLEIWILLGLGVAGIAAAAYARCRRRPANREDNNIYPLW